MANIDVPLQRLRFGQTARRDVWWWYPVARPTIAVIVPQLVEPRWYDYLLHNQTASMMKALLLFRGGPQTIIVNVPWHLRDWRAERRRLCPADAPSRLPAWWRHRPSRMP